MNLINKIYDQYPDEIFLLADNLNDAIIGIEEKSLKIIYLTSKIIKILMNDMSYDDAIEFYYFNIEGADVGEKTPIFCNDLI